MAKGAGSKAAVVLLLIGVCGVAALALYIKSDPRAARVAADMRRPDDESVASKPSPSIVHTEPRETSPSTEPQSILVPSIEDGKLGSEMAKTEVPDGKDPKVFLTEQIVKGVKLDNARVLGVDVRNGTAVINFGDGIDSGMGSDQEGLFLNALQKAFGQFPEVQKLELDKEGQPLDSVGGHIDLSDGLPVTRPGSSDAASKPSSP